MKTSYSKMLKKYIVSNQGTILSTHATLDEALTAMGVAQEPEVKPIAATDDEDDYLALWELMHTPAE